MMDQTSKKCAFSSYMREQLAVSMTTGRILNIPNILTLARIALIPVFLLVAYWPPAMSFDAHNPDMTRHIILTTIFVVAAVTDWFDGYLARTLNQTSAFGRFLDPVADKLMVAAALIVLVQWQPSMSMAFAAIVIISREITVSALREWMAELGARIQCCGFNCWKIQNSFPDDRHYRIPAELATAGNTGICLAIYSSCPHFMVNVYLSESGLAISETTLIEITQIKSSWKRAFYGLGSLKMDKSQAKIPSLWGRTGIKSGYLLLIIIVIQRCLIFLGLIIESQFFKII